MKKMIISIMATVCVMTMVCGAFIAGMKSNYDAKLEEVKAEYEAEIKEISLERMNLELDNIDLRHRYADLEEQVYNVMEGKPYDVSIDYNDVYHTYKSENKNIFSAVNHTAMWDVN